MVDPGLTTLVKFAGTNGANPHAPLLFDAAGDLFGTTQHGGAYGGPTGYGTVFELVKTGAGYASTPTTLVSFNGTDGADPYGGLIADAAGDLFGVTQSGTVYEIVKTGSGYAATPTVLVTFNGTDGASPEGELLADPAGDLFGVTQEGGAYGKGTVFEIAKTAGGYASTPTVLVSFNGTNGADPTRPLIFDRFYDLYSTTAQGGAYNDGTVFEIANTGGFGSYASTPTTLVSFNGSDGAQPFGGVIMDTAGDLFGTTAAGGASGNGTVFEIANTIVPFNPGRYAATPTVLVSFSGGYSDSLSGLIADARGDLFGTTTNLTAGGDNNGTVFEITKTASGYTSAPLLIDAFNGTNGAVPDGTPLIVDSAGNLFGTTYSGGFGDGTVFEDSINPVLFSLPPSEMVGGPYSGNESSSFGPPIALTLSLSNGVNNSDVLTTVLSVPSGVIQVGGSSGSTVTLSGTATAISSEIRFAEFLPNPGGYGQFTLTMTTSDTNAQVSATAQITVNDTSVPSVAAGGPYAGAENTPFAVGGASVSASPNAGDPLSVVVSVAHGTLTAAAGGGSAVISGSGTASLTLTGTAANIDKALATASDAPSTNYYGSDSLSVMATDTVDGQNASGAATITIADTTAPSVSAGGLYSGSENAPLAVGGASVSASPNAGDPLSVVVSVANGKLTASAGGGSAGISGSGTASLTLTGTAADIDKALATASDAPTTNYYGSDSLSVTATDTADNQQATGSAAITIADTTAPSVNAGGPYSGSENAPFAVGGASVLASPNAGDPLSVVVSVAQGTLTASAGGGSAMIAGSGTARLTLTGTAADIDKALATASDTPTTNYYGSDNLSVTATDTADGQSASGAATITIADTTLPSVSAGGPYGGSENSSFAVGGASVSASPNAGDPLSVVVSVSQGVPTASAGGGSAMIAGSGTASLTLTGTAADIDKALATASDTPTTNYYGSDSLSVTTTDTADGQHATGSATITIADTTTPSVSAGGPYGGSENSSFAVGGASASASPNAGDPLSVVVSVAHGTLTATAGGGSAGIAGSGTASLTLTGTATDIDKALATASDTPTTNYYGSDSLSVTATDTADGKSATQTAPITVKPGGFMSSVPDAGGYGILYEGTGGHNLSIANVTINGNVGVGGTGVVQYSGPGTINGHLDFSAANTGQYHDANGKNVGPTAVNYSTATVTSALSEINSLSTTLGKENGNNIAISGNMTINASAGVLDSNGNYVFNVTSYNEGNGNVVTINGDGLGGSVVLNFGFNSNVNLGGDVALTGGLRDDQVLWNFTTSGKNINLNNNESSYPLPLAFQGVILAPGDNLSMVSANLDGRLWGGGSGDMQLNGGDTLTQSNQAQSAALLMQYAAAGFGGGSGQGAASIDNATTSPPPAESPFITIPHH